MTVAPPIRPGSVLIDPKTGQASRDLFLLLNYLSQVSTNLASLVIEDAINNGVLNMAPSENAVFDALALKANASALSAYLTTAAAAAGYQPLDTQLTTLAALADASGALTNDGAGNFSWAASGITATQFVTWTPTFTGFGTPTSISAWSRRIGDSLEAYGTYTSGTVTAVEPRISLGFNGVDGGITSDSTKISTLQLAGSFVRKAAIAPYAVLIESGVGYVTFGSSANPFTKVSNATASFGSSEQHAFYYRVPISGWS